MSDPAARTLQDWLSWQESLHLSAIDLGLDRIAVVAGRMGLLAPAFPVITVAGTNGKGSTTALLTSILHTSGYRVGTYTSPHILRYNERVALDGQPVADELLCAAFTAIDAARLDVSLTYFEFGTLAAMWVFTQHQVDVAVLEVGLGGRLDASNLWDADVAVITAIGIDHVEWLGDNREDIGREKAGIARAGKALICGDPHPPASIAATAALIGAQLLQNGVDFRVEPLPEGRFSIHLQPAFGREGLAWLGLPRPVLQGDVQMNNAACAVLAVQQLVNRLPLSGRQALEDGIRLATLPGRLQKIQSRPDVWVDVAHNPHAAENLAEWLQKSPVAGKTYVIFSILADKDITGVIKPLLPHVDEWHFFPLVSPRAASLPVIQAALDACHVQHPVSSPDLQHAWAQLAGHLQAEDRVVIFGSFLVVSKMLDGIF